MKFSLSIDETVPETTVHVTAPELTDEIVRLEQFVTTGAGPRRIIGSQNSRATLLDPANVLRFYTQDRAVWAHTRGGNWRLKERLKDLDALLPPRDFIRINQGEIVNLSAVKELDFSATSTIGITLVDGTRCFVARRSLANFRTALNAQ